jgi:hypothetical protein
VACCVLAVVALAVDAYFSAQEGYLSRPADYDGIGYMVFARSAYLQLTGLHLHAGLAELLTIAPGWNAALAFQYLVFGAGTWPAFTVRFWADALLLVLVYWIVSRRAPRSLAVAATVMTALLPVASAGVRSSSWEFFSGQANYYENFGLDDLRPDLLAIALILWAIAVLAEQGDRPSRSTFVVSAVFTAAAVLVKPSTSPLMLALWAAALGATWFWNRRRSGIIRTAALGVGVLVVLLLPWAIVGKGVLSVANYLYAVAVTYRSAYGTNEGLLERLTYFLVRIPTDLGQVEAWLVIAGAVLLVIALVRRGLGRAELIYGTVALALLVGFSLPSGRNSHLAEWTSVALWIFFWAGVARIAPVGWPFRMTPLSLKRGELPPQGAGPGGASSRRTPLPTHSPAGRAGTAVLAAVGVYTLVVYALGAFAIANWPANEQRSNAQLSEVTASLAHALGAHISTSDCFAFAPGPSWPATIQFVLMDASGRFPASTGTDIDTSTSTTDYVATAKKCAAVIAYRENITQVAQVFYAPVAYQPYLQAVSDWVHGPGSGYTLDRSWSFFDLAPFGDHTLGRYQGVSLTVDLYLRSPGQS